MNPILLIKLKLYESLGKIHAIKFILLDINIQKNEYNMPPSSTKILSTSYSNDLINCKREHDIINLQVVLFENEYYIFLPFRAA